MPRFTPEEKAAKEAARATHRHEEKLRKLRQRGAVYMTLNEMPSSHRKPGKAPADVPMEAVTLTVPAKLAKFLRYDARRHGWKPEEIGHYVAMRLFTHQDVQAHIPMGGVLDNEDFAAAVDHFLPVTDQDLGEYLQAEFPPKN